MLDGISGTGKTMLMRFLDGLEDVNVPIFDYQLEQLLITHYLGKIESEAFQTLLSLLVDQRLYDLGISRQINLRFSDLSSVWKSKKRSLYLRQLLSSDASYDFGKSHEQNSVLAILVHQLLDATLTLDENYQGIVKRIVCARHPYYLFEHWLSYVENFGKNPRDFTVTIGNEGRPWFIESTQEDFSKISRVDKAAHCIYALALKQEAFFSSCKNLIVIDFEKFVLQPTPYLTLIENYLQKEIRYKKSISRKEHIPRIHINDSKDLLIYRKYFSDKLEAHLSHKEDYQSRKESILKRVSKVSREMLVYSAELYESRFGVWYE